MKRLIRRSLQVLGALLSMAAAAIAAAIAFDEPPRPPVLAEVGGIPEMADWNRAEIPPIQHLAARDGAPLAYRAYPGSPDRIVVLVHGSTGTALDMHKVAQALQVAGATVYSISLRGHGGSGTVNGDVSYVGQLDDDLADLVKGLGLDRPNQKRTMIGFSAGGGFVLRTASGRMRRLFDDYIAVSPYVMSYVDVRRRHLGWVNAATLRIGGLYIIDHLGLPLFQDLVVARYATETTPDDMRTPAYSYRMLASIHMGLAWRREMARIEAPTVILTSPADQLSNASRYTKAVSPHLQVRQTPDFGHVDMITKPAAIAEIVATWRLLTGADGAKR